MAKKRSKVIQLRKSKPGYTSRALDVDFLDRQFRKNPKPLREETCQEFISKYHTIIVFATPQEIVDLDIGYTLDQFPYDEEELNQYFPYDLGTLCQEIRYTTIGVVEGEEISYPIPESMCEVNVVINVNGRYCKLNKGEWSGKNLMYPMTPSTQIRVFQRLLNQKQITMHDLEAADIDTNVYKKLMLNEKMGELLYRKKMAMILSWLDRQKEDPILQGKIDHFMKYC